MGNIFPSNKSALLSILYWLRPHSLLIAAVAEASLPKLSSSLSFCQSSETNGGSSCKRDNCLEWSPSIRIFKICASILRNLSNLNADLISRVRSSQSSSGSLQTSATCPSVRYVPLKSRKLNCYFTSLCRFECRTCVITLCASHNAETTTSFVAQGQTFRQMESKQFIQRRRREEKTVRESYEGSKVCDFNSTKSENFRK